MALRFLVDTSMLKRLDRGGLRRIVEPLAAAGHLGRANIGDPAAAEELDVGVLHYDADFDLIASVTGQRCEWVVPAGSIA